MQQYTKIFAGFGNPAYLCGYNHCITRIMYHKTLSIILLMAGMTFANPTNAKKDEVQPTRNYIANRHPLAKKTYMAMPLGDIKAEGWLEEQLKRMRSGLTGNLDKIYERVCGPRNCWLGGDGDAWERGPYWIDGLLPLAYILDDDALKEKVKPWIEWTLASQQENGQFGPTVDRSHEPGLQRNNAQDWWPRMVMLKIMQQYYQATGDERVITFMSKYFRYQLNELPSKPLGNWTFWGQQRGGDNLQVVYWLYNITGERFLLDLGEMIHRQTIDWTNYFNEGEILTRQLSLHCVNLAQGFKEPVVYYQQGKDPKYLQAPKNAVKTMRNTIGLPTGLWGGDELLRFGEPTMGSELCTATEMMFSLESMLEITGDVQWADHLERVAYNVLPTQHDDDFMSRQYYQQTNQVCVTKAWRQFTTPHEDTDILFGTLTGYPCCTCNMHQSWPKLVQNLWYATTDHGIAALVYGPSTVNATVADGIPVTIKEETNYPFSEEIKFTVNFDNKKQKEAAFPIHLRIPSWCQNPVLTVNGDTLKTGTAQGEIAVVYRTWKQGDVLTLELPMKVSTSRWYCGGAVVERGPLLYALKMQENWNKKEFGSDRSNTYGNWYYEVTSPTAWNYGLRHHHLNQTEQHFEVVQSPTLATYPWNVQNAPITLRTKAIKMKDWTLSRNSCGPINYYSQQGQDYEKEEYEIELIPYGCTTLRITEFPVR